MDSGRPDALAAARASLAACQELLGGAPARPAQSEDRGRELGALVAAEAARALAARRSDLGVRVLHRIDDGLRVSLRVELVERIVRNLLLNAIEASHEGGRVRVRCERVGQELLLEVTDEGRGLDLERRSALYTGGPWERPRGTGLGRASVRACALRLGATLSVEGAPGRGTRVTMRWREAPVVGLLADVPPARARARDRLRGEGYVVLEEDSVLELLHDGGAIEGLRVVVARGHGALEAEEWGRIAELELECVSALDSAP